MPRDAFVRYFTRLGELCPFRPNSSRSNKKSCARRLQSSLSLEGLEDRLVPATLTLTDKVLTYQASAGVANHVTVSIGSEFDPDYSLVSVSDSGETINCSGFSPQGNHTNSIVLEVYKIENQIHGLTLNLGNKDDFAQVAQTLVPTEVSGGQGNDTFVIGGFSLDGIQADVAFDGGAGSNGLTVDDDSGYDTDGFTIYDQHIDLDNAYGFDHSIQYTNLDRLRLDTSGQNSYVEVNGTAAGTQTTLALGVGTDAVFVGYSLDDMQGPIDVFRDSSYYDAIPIHVTLSDSGDSGHIYAVNTHVALQDLQPYEQIQRDGHVIVSVQGLIDADVEAGYGADLVAINGTLPDVHLSIDTGYGDDGVIIGNASHGLDNIWSTVDVAAGTSDELPLNELHINDAGAASGHAYTLQAFEFDRDGVPVITYTHFSTLNIDTSSRDDHLLADSTVANQNVFLDMRSGNDTLQAPNTKSDFYLTGQNKGSLVDTDESVSVLGKGLASPVQFQKVENLQGGKGADTFHFTNAGKVTGGVDGGAGINQLDFSARTTDVTVNLKRNQASGVGGKALNFQNVLGGAGDDLLIGDAGANVIYGGAGNDVIIGGGGADTLGGGVATRFSQSGSDLLIAGSTAYDNNADALTAIWQEWSKSGRRYAERIANLRAGLGRSGIALNSNTVFLDEGVSKLTGGADLDWFWANRDEVLDLERGESIN